MRHLHLCVLVICLTLIGEIGCQAPPEWVETLQEAFSEGVSESTPVDAFLGRLSAVDPNEGTVRYGSDSSLVNVHGDTGNVTLRTPLDREETAVHSITFYAFANAVQSTVTVQLVVRDENDNAPEFLNPPYSAIVNEALPTRGDVFDGIVIIDRDTNGNAEVTLSCVADSPQAVEACDTFGVRVQRVSPGQYRGAVILNRALTYSYRSQYTLTLRAQDGGMIPLSATTSVSITVNAAVPDTLPPRILNTPLSFQVFENQILEEPVLMLQAETSNPSSSVNLIFIIKTTSVISAAFRIGDTTRSGNIYTAPLHLSGRLDREEADNGFYIFTIQAKEVVTGAATELIMETSVEVSILDVNDNAPQITMATSVLAVPESLRKDNVVPGFSAVVVDQDAGDKGFFELRLEGAQAGKFRLSPSVGSQRAVVSLILNENLDFDFTDIRSYQLRVVAQETETAEKRSSVSEFTINILDTNDNAPQFTSEPYRPNVREDRAVGFSITTISARDADSGRFGRISYSLEGSNKNLLRIDPTTGEVFLAGSLDYESVPRFSVTVAAEDGGGKRSVTTLEVNVLDFNDQAPAFVRDEYRATVEESSVNLRPPVIVEAKDKESDEKVTYSILSGNIDNAFMINATSGRLTMARQISFDKTPDGLVVLTVQASDNGNPAQKSTVPVIITVLDVNDNSPVLENSVFRRTISETDPPGTSIATLRATDADSGLNGEVNYVMGLGSRENFVVHPTTGLVTVAPSAVLDIDRFPRLYDMIVYAVDRGSPQRTANARIFVTVLDSNNKNPEFSEDLYTFTVVETVSRNTNVGSVQATDPDSGSRIQYRIDADSVTARDKTGQVVTDTEPVNYKTLFRIEPASGAIYTQNPLDRDRVAEVSFTVLAEDVSPTAETTQIGQAVVIITIRSPDDGGLNFNPPWSPQNPVIVVFIAEEEPVGTPITTIVAHDPETNRPIVDYRKIGESDPNNFFIVNVNTGQVFLNKRMDYEDPATRQRSFRIEAFNEAQQSAIATVTVRTTDINDHEPKFKLTTYTFDASEGLESGSQFGTVIADDDDDGINGQITYSLSGPGADVFRIDPQGGFLEIREDRSLDREWMSEFDLIVTATDGGGRYTEVPLKIRVLDINDNDPQFDTPVYNMYTMEYIPPYSELGRVRASDDDDGANGAITYRIVGGNDLALFEIDTSSGIVRPRVPLRSYARELPYSLTVEARDGGAEPRVSTATVEIHVSAVDNQDGRPVITYPPDNLEIVIPENATIGTDITHIEATDSDVGPEGQLEYGFVPNPALDKDHSYFYMDPQTGRITIRQELDRETKDIYELVVYVRDKGAQPNTITRKIIVKVTDVDDNKPNFKDTSGCPKLDEQWPIYASVREDVDIGTRVTRVQACDSDLPPYNTVYYYIVCGNEVSPTNSFPAFSINKNTGVIVTDNPLDRETVPEYNLCVYASNSPEPPEILETPPEGMVTGRRRKREVVDINSDSMTTVIVKVTDVNDNGPNFLPQGSSGERTVVGIASELPYSSDIIQIRANDPDGQADYRYSITQMSYVYGEDSGRAVSAQHFIIDANNGMVTNGLESYAQYAGGYFEVKVKATDSMERSAETTLLIYILSSSQRSKFVFDSTPQNMQRVYEDFFSELAGYLEQGTQIRTDSLRYAIDKEGKALYNGTDICLYLLREQRVVGQEETQRLLVELGETSGPVRSLYTRYGVSRVDRCLPHVTTKWWSDWWWLWWLLIALALFIILVTIIVLIILCCCWPKAEKSKYYAVYEKPYVILDPVNVIPPNYGYEWQEQVVKMN